MDSDTVRTVAAVREAQARQCEASRDDRRRSLNCRTVGGHRPPLQLAQIAILFSLAALVASCSKPAAPAPVKEPEAQSRTEFTGRVENYFEYERLHSGR